MVDVVNRFRQLKYQEIIIISTTPTQIRTNSDIKKQATILFEKLGLDMSGAVNIFLYQCVLRGGLPFPVEIPQYSTETLNAMAEAKRISSDSNIKGYSSMEALQEALED